MKRALLIIALGCAIAGVVGVVTVSIPLVGLALLVGGAAAIAERYA